MLIWDRRPQSCTLTETFNGNFDEPLEAEFGPTWEWETWLPGCSHTFISFSIRNLIRFSQWIATKDPLVSLAVERGKVIAITPKHSPWQKSPLQEKKKNYQICIPLGKMSFLLLPPLLAFLLHPTGGKDQKIFRSISDNHNSRTQFH